MSKTLMVILAIAVTLCLLATAGCTNASPPATRLAVQTTPHYPTVSINATPVQYAEVNGISLAYREFGSGEPLLLVPGFGATMDTAWNETFLGILATQYHVYTYDHRGMGYSGDNDATPAISQYAEDAAGLMTALGYDSMHVYGASMGSTVSQQLVIDHPERVRKLVLDSVTYSIRVPETQLLFSIINESATDPTQTAGVREEARANLAWNGSWDNLSGIQKDVMLVVGTEDVLTPDPVTVRMAGQINGSWLVRFRGLPHVGSHYAPVEYGENALNFLGMDESPLE
ncbi:MAG: alpha/beta hydrolase [Methanoregula sp.]|uniref:alpha/beta fold hydrolase n=1 Tax=Methanoregula sp. TaxID=2052170 RepID=UPI0025DB7902|nr:alpha/beta hydrolase [Methanoregula sp.]MCK9630843.1 alpha/beta hydrolase [Methanoregula sp.]